MSYAALDVTFSAHALAGVPNSGLYTDCCSTGKVTLAPVDLLLTLRRFRKRLRYAWSISATPMGPASYRVPH